MSWIWGTLAGLEPVGDYPLRSTAGVYEDLASGEYPFGGPVPLGAPAAMSSTGGMEIEVTPAVGATSGDGVVVADPDLPVSSDDPAPPPNPCRCRLNPCPSRCSSRWS